MIEIITHHEFKDTIPEQVWRILTHFESYSKWNPFIIKANQVNDKRNTQLTHSETFSGLITCIINQDKQNKIKKSFENMNVALEERIHHLSQGAQP